MASHFARISLLVQLKPRELHFANAVFGKLSLDVTQLGESRHDPGMQSIFTWQSLISTAAPPRDLDDNDVEDEEDDEDGEVAEDHGPAVIREPDEDE